MPLPACPRHGGTTGIYAPADPRFERERRVPTSARIAVWAVDTA